MSDGTGHAKYLLEEQFLKDKKGASKKRWEELRNHVTSLTLVKEKRKERSSRKSLIMRCSSTKVLDKADVEYSSKNCALKESHNRQKWTGTSNPAVPSHCLRIPQGEARPGGKAAMDSKVL